MWSTITFWLISNYSWLVALHVISIIAWMAAILYLPRLFMHHSMVEQGSPASESFKVMERTLLRGVMTPFMIASWVFGLAIVAAIPGYLSQGWLHSKLLLVVLLTGLHGVFARWVRNFAKDRNRRSRRFYRVMAEAPTVLMVGIVILVVVKPF